MADFYMSHTNNVNRLMTEHLQHGSLIVAYDYDNTVYDYHGQGRVYTQVIDLLRRCKAVGMTLIVFTASSPTRYQGIETYLKENKIPYDSLNEDVIPTGGRKLYYNILLDDRAGLESAYNALEEVVSQLEVKGRHEYTRSV